AQVMEEATQKINIKDLGIEYLRPKRAKTGGLILEVPGENSAARADLLAAKLAEALGDKEGLRIARPITMAELRITGLDDAASTAKVEAAIAEAGGCSLREIKVGDLRKAPSGLLSAWARCPKTAAERIAKTGKIMVGWSAVKVEMLGARPLQCHRCLEFGHVRAKCPAEEDRSSRCYRCGQPGHKAAGCVAAPKCQLCEAKGRVAGHRLGGAAC
ncbi:Uncharacterized 50 kDa protein in type I retrotransposable element R1DM, partial [Camponotus floridanus]